jgi:two-component system OmpR family sensor kinase
MTSERPGLVRRVAVVGAAAAAIGGALAAAVSGIVASRLVATHEDDVVLATAFELADEIIEELEELEEDGEVDDDEDIEIDAEGRPILASVLAHELKDVKQPGANAVILEQGRAIAGDPSVPAAPQRACTTTGHGPMARRVCAVPLQGERVLVLAVSAVDERERFALVAWALVIGALVGAAAGGVLSHRGAAWAMAPVTDLRDRVRAIDPAAPRSELLDPPARHAEIEALREAVAELVERLGESLAHAQSFAAQAAHELRTPLSLLAGELELMLESTTLTADDARIIERLRMNVADLVALTQRLLVLAGPGRLPVEVGEPVDLSDVLEAVLENVTPAQATRIRATTADDVVVRGDPELLRSMLHNAVDNALKFSSGPVELSVSANEDAILDVVDHGPGVAAGDRRRIFAPFVRGRGESARTVPGHGIGLALIAHVVQAHGGRAAFVDVPSGACLRIRLPLWRA